MAMVVRPLAAWSRAAWTTFSDVESRAEVAYHICQHEKLIQRKSFLDLPRLAEELWGYAEGHGR